MTFRFPQTVGAAAGLMMTFFIIGIALHSAFRQHILSLAYWAIILAGMCLIILQLRSWRGRVMCLFILSFAVGLCRVDVAPLPRLQRVDNRLFISRNGAKDSSSLLARWRQAITRRIVSVLSRDEATLVTGILYGDQDLSKTQRELFKTAGLMHIVAVSGSNVTVVVQFVALFFFTIGCRRRLVFWLSSIALVLFVGFVGFAASVARAAFMGWLMLLAHELGRVLSPMRLLLVSATILLLIDPWQLFFDIGFALSFLAMWGLLVWCPVFESWFQFLPKRFEIRSTLAMTASATLATAPYMAWMFQRVSLAGLFTNILALPLVPFTMAWGAIAGIWGPSVGSAFVSAPVFGFARAIEFVAGLSRYVPWLDLHVSQVSFSTAIATYVLLVYLRSLLSVEKDLSERIP